MSADLRIVPPRSRGRPSLFEAAFCERVLELAADGCGKAEIAAALEVSRETLNAWIRCHPEFRDAMSRAKDLEYAWWLKQGRENQFNKAWNAASWALQMRNRFGTRFSEGVKTQPKDKQKDTVNAGQIRAEMERKLSRIADAGTAEEVPGEPYTEGAG